jgi:hypothetical protein
MRNIKFRGLRTDGNGWVYGSFIHNNIDCECIIDIDAEQFEVLPESVGQFTGLTDKNGIEIYEFDYVLDEFNQRILVEYNFILLSRLNEIKNKITLDGNYYE